MSKEFDKFIQGKKGEWFFDIDQRKGLCGGMFYRKSEARQNLILKITSYLDKLEIETYSVIKEDKNG